MKKRLIQFKFLALMGLMCVFAFLCGRTFCFHRYVFVNHNGATFIYPQDTFPGCLETENYIQLYQQLSQKTEISEKETNAFLCLKILDLRTKAVIRAQNCDYDISQAILQTLDNLSNWDRPPQSNQP